MRERELQGERVTRRKSYRDKEVEGDKMCVSACV